MSAELDQRPLTTADLIAAAAKPVRQLEVHRSDQEPLVEMKDGSAANADEQLTPLFLADVAEGFRSRWSAVQIGFVDDPHQAVRQADELVAQVMQSLAQTFTDERAKVESQVDEAQKASTEDLRVALRRYRSFFERLLAL